MIDLFSKEKKQLIEFITEMLRSQLICFLAVGPQSSRTW